MQSQQMKKSPGPSFLVSEKLDGIRAFWDGGCTRGMLVNAVSWANKDKNDGKRLCTGLWTRYGHPISAPNWFTDPLPAYPLDGEIYNPQLDLAAIRSIVLRHEPDGRWSGLDYHVFDTVPWRNFISPRQLKWVGNFNTTLTPKRTLQAMATYDERYELIKTLEVTIVEHYHIDEAKPLFDRAIEGIMYRERRSIWWPTRSLQLLKQKKRVDSTCMVVGYTNGEGRHIGRLGALVCKFPIGNVTFNIGTGFTDDERENARDLFPLNKIIDFSYRCLSSEGVPLEPRI